MATYQVRQRDPLLDQNMQAMLERRGRELLGLVLIAVGIAAALMLYSYSPDDPGWMVATDEPAANMLGRFGAAASSTLIIIGGVGAWGIPLVLMTWGARFMLHRGSDRVLGRIVFAVIAVAFGSIYAATLVPGASWTHSFGLGGLFGDTVLGALLNMIPIGAGIGLKLLSVVMGLAFLGMALFVTGFDIAELRRFGRFLIVGSIVTYSAIVGMLGKGAHSTVRSTTRLTHAVQGRQAARRATVANLTPQQPAAPLYATHAAPAPLGAHGHAKSSPVWGSPSILRADPRYREPLAEAPHYAAPKEKLGLLARMPQLMRRALEPQQELVEAALPATFSMQVMPSEDRIKARISSVIALRATNPATNPADNTPHALRREPPLVARPAVSRPDASRLTGPAPLIADTRRTPGFTMQIAPTAAPVTEDDDDLAIAADWQDDDFDDDFALPTLVADDRRPVVHMAVKKPTAPSRQALAESQPRLRFEDPAPAYELPPLSLLSSPVAIQRGQLSNEALAENARMLKSVLDDYGVRGDIVNVRPGPVVTMYELEPAPGLKASRVIGLADDIARSMSALSARVSTVPGRTVIGIELPNVVREKVVLREILSARDFGDSAMRLPLALGKDIAGEPIVANLAKMPHLLIAGTTGSGKSVAINTMILSLLYKLSPEECRLIMIDPKMLELSVYDGIPHLLSPVVTDPKKAVVALKWVVGEMEERYRKMSKMGVRNIEGFNGRVREALARGEMFKRTIQTGFDDDTGEPVFETDEFQPVAIPYIVVVVDEMADLMMVAGKEIEACIQRLAQMARASGIHLIMATQRPSVDVITGTIKANFPTRISFQVTSKIDSRTILGEQGAEQLLGMGDMLYMAGGGRVCRIHGPFVSDEEVEEIVNHLKSYGPPAYMSGVVEGPEDDTASDIDMVLGLGGDSADDTLYDQAVAIVAKDRKCSTSYIQRKLGIGYNKAAKLVEQLEDQGVVTPANHVGKREILVAER